MDEKEEGVLLGELKSFKHEALHRFDQVDDRMSKFELKLTELDHFKWKVTFIMGAIVGSVEIVSRFIQFLHYNGALR